MSLALEHFYKTTAINSWDLAGSGMRPNPVAVGYCPVELNNYQPRLSSDSSSTEQQEYIDKAVKFIKSQMPELGGFIDIDGVINAAVDSIKAGWNDIMQKGHTVGVMGEVTAAFGLGVVGGLF